jgi:hypothetical protein
MRNKLGENGHQALVASTGDLEEGADTWSTGHSAEVANAGVQKEESTDGATGH